MAPGNSSTYIVGCPLDDLGIDIGIDIDIDIDIDTDIGIDIDIDIDVGIDIGIGIDIDTQWHLVTPPPTLLVALWMVSVLILILVHSGT